MAAHVRRTKWPQLAYIAVTRTNSSMSMRHNVVLPADVVAMGARWSTVSCRRLETLTSSFA